MTRRHRWALAGCAIALSGIAAITYLARAGGGPRMLLVGLDGADWSVIRPLVEAGRLPNLARLCKEGASGPLLSEPPLLSPVVWPTIATGKPPAEHGITSFVVERHDREGRALPVQRTERTCRALWNTLSEQGRSVSVVGWWATYPAETVRGRLVSDVVGYHNFSVSGRGIEASLGKVYPPELWPEVAETLRSPEEVGHEELSDLAQVSKAEFETEMAESASRPAPAPLAQLRQMVATATGYVDLACRLDRERRADWTAVYLNATDWAGHLFARFAPPSLPDVSPEGCRRYERTFEGVYLLVDRLLGKLLERWGEDDYVLVLSDHGFLTGTERRPEGDSVEIGHAHEWHRPEGILIVRGPGVLPGSGIRNARIYDVAPTSLHLLGLAVPEDMPGKVLLSLLSPEEVGRRPVRRIATYESRPSPVEGARAELDDPTAREVQRNLEALGYLGASSALPARALLSRADMKERTGRESEAVEDVERAVAAEPSNPAIRARLAGLYERKGDGERALYQWRAAVRMSPDEAAYRFELARLLLARSRETEALAHLKKACELDPSSVPIRLALGDAFRKRGEFEVAEKVFRSLTASHPDEGAAWYNLGVCLGDNEEKEAAREAYRTCLRLDPGNARAESNLANLLLAEGEIAEALGMYRRVVERQPGSFEAHYNLGTALLQIGAPTDAVGHLEEAARLDPDDRNAAINLGLAQALDHRFADALRTLLRVPKQFPDDVEAATAVARVLVATGAEDPAREVLRRAIVRHRERVEPLGAEAGRFGEIVREGLAAAPAPLAPRIRPPCRPRGKDRSGTRAVRPPSRRPCRVRARIRRVRRPARRTHRTPPANFPFVVGATDRIRQVRGPRAQRDGRIALLLAGGGSGAELPQHPGNPLTKGGVADAPQPGDLAVAHAFEVVGFEGEADLRRQRPEHLPHRLPTLRRPG